MDTIINVSVVTDYSGDTPSVTYSNPVTTVVTRPDPPPICCCNCECCCCNCCCCECEE